MNSTIHYKLPQPALTVGDTLTAKAVGGDSIGAPTRGRYTLTYCC